MPGRRLLVWTTAAVVGALAVGGGTASAAHPGANGVIAFHGSTGVGFGTNIYTVNPDGTGLANLTQNAEFNEWYHDFLGFSPAWSADGTTIAFDAVAPFSHNPAGQLCGDTLQTIWSLVPASGEIDIVNPCGGGSSWVFPEQMSWSPDGSLLVTDHHRNFEAESKIILIDVDTGAKTTLVAPAPYDFCGPGSLEGVLTPSWSPLGDSIVYARNALGTCNVTGLWTTDPDGSNRAQLTYGADASPDWSPDGSSIVFVRQASNNWCAPCAGAIYKVDAEGGIPTLLTDVGFNTEPVFSPDGTKIAFASNRNGGFHIFVMDADGSNVQQVTNLGFEREPSWQPLTAPPDPDADDDGVDDTIDVGAGAFDDGAGTTGSLVDAAGLSVLVEDADEAGDGVKITVGPGTGKATFTVCGFTLKVSAGSEVVVSCASITVEVVEGSAEVVLGGGSVVVSVPDGGIAKVSDAGGTFFSVQNLGPTGVGLTVDGTTSTLPAGNTTSVSVDVTDPTVTCNASTWLLNQPGATVTASVSDGGSGPAQTPVGVPVSTASPGSHAVSLTGFDQAGNLRTVSCPYTVRYAYAGFLQPIDNAPTLNTAKAGQSIPVRWRITDYHGVGVSDPASFVGVASSPGSCSTGGGVDALETYSGGSGLQYNGDGNWQFNWRAPRTYAGQCRDLQLNLADEATGRVAAFSFK